VSVGLQAHGNLSMTCRYAIVISGTKPVIKGNVFCRRRFNFVESNQSLCHNVFRLIEFG
jgi:hypothetical protein